MSAQEDGMLQIGYLVRALTPPELDFVVLVFPMDGPLSGRMAFVTSTTIKDGDKRAREAAQVFASEKTGAKPTFKN